MLNKCKSVLPLKEKYKMVFINKKQERSIIVVKLLSSDIDYYFGSVRAIYEMFNSDEVGISYNTLKNYGVSFDKLFSNKKCEISKSIIITKTTDSTTITEIKGKSK